MAKSKLPGDMGQPIPFDPDFDGPLKKRSCTDIICLLIFIIFIGCWTGIAIYAFSTGDPYTLLAPKDSAGSRCGLDGNVKDKPYLFFFDLTKCLSAAVPFTGCPTPQVCVAKCPSQNFFFQNAPDDFARLICKYDIVPNTNDAKTWVDSGQCAHWYLESHPFQKRCIPDVNEETRRWFSDNLNRSADDMFSAVSNIKALSQAEQIGQNVVNDLINSWWKILIGVGMAVGVCIIYIAIMRWFAGVLVWFSMIGVLALLSAGIYFSSKKYLELRNQSDDVENESDNMLQSYMTKKNTWLSLLIIASAFLIIILIILIFLRKRILLATALIKEGSKAVGSVTSVLFFPIFPWIFQVGVIAFAISVALYLATTGQALYKVRGMTNECGCSAQFANNSVCDPDSFSEACLQFPTCNDATCKFITMKNPNLYPYLQAINIFGFFWGTFFVSAVGQMILASVFATWYWTFRKSNLPFFAVIEATLRTLRYHIGTVAFGSLIITICRIIRVLLEYIDHKLKKYDNALTKAILCCCKCFFWCLESFLKFINRNAYIMCAIHGKSFCGSAKDAFLLLMRNILRTFVLDKVTDFLFFLGKVLITLGVGAVAYVCFATDLTSIDNSALNYNNIPVIVIMVCTFFIATIFFNVYTMAVDTLFLCFLEDCERNDGSSEKPYYMSKNLMKILGKKNKRE